MNIIKSKLSKRIVGVIISFITILLMYIGVSVYFKDRFCFGSAVNNISLAGKTVEEANQKISSEINTYKIEVIERNNKKEYISANEMGLENNAKGKIKELKEDQNPLGWLPSLLKTNNKKTVDIVKVNEDLLKQSLGNLQCFDESNVVEPENPTLKYDNDDYKVSSMVEGNKLNKDVVYEKVLKAVLNGKTSVNLDKEGCYEKPKYDSNSKEVVNSIKKLNKYVNSKVTINFGDNKEVINGEVINKWLSVDENYNVTLDEEAVEDYVKELSYKYNTIGITRKFTNSYGNVVSVSGGSYGYSIDKEKEIEDILKIVKDGDEKEVEPTFKQKSFTKIYGSDDIGKTYVEVNLTTQHLWFYKDGVLIVDGDVVTGKESDGHGTPEGTYFLAYKQKDTILKGQGYNSPVAFWMPFNNGIGIHDASWRHGVFGGQIYYYGGSHGCVNASYDLACTIYNNIEAGTPIVCYH